MQIKIIIGTVAFMMAMMVLGYSALREPARLDRFTDARVGRQIEVGAHLYEANCTNCHGENAKAEECYDASSGEPIGCIGLPLNYAPLLCGDVSLRMEALNWEGTKGGLINATLVSGRYGTQMASWAQEFGGPLRPDELEDLTNFILNYETEELCSTPIVTYDWPATYADFKVEFPEGDPVRGEELYLSYGCTGCHGNLEDPASAAVGPWQGNIAEVGATRIEGYTADEYVYESILNPNAYIVPECPTGPCAGPPSAMPDNFPLRMAENPQDMRDVMIYLLGE
jgi:mono/diheme cytochrome c family protein